MSDMLVGVLALLAGLLLTLRGQAALRLALAVWGGFVGFSLGAGLASLVTGEGVLAGPVAWVAAIVGALLFSGLAYAFYALAVIITLGSIGYGLAAMFARGIDLGPALAMLAGVVGALALALLGLVIDLPRLVLILLSAVAGAAVALLGLAMLLGLADSTALAGTHGVPTTLEGPWWGIGYAALVVAGVVVQSRTHAWSDARARWGRMPSWRRPDA